MGAAAQDEEEDPDADLLINKFKAKPITEDLKSRLRNEVQSMGDLDAPQSSGNPYLLIIVIVAVLGIASYFSLGLDKIGQPGGKCAKSDEEMVQQLVQMSNDMK